MIKKLTIILAIFHLNIAFSMFAMSAAPIKGVIDPPNTAALNLLTDALSALKELRKHNKASAENVETLIKSKMLPSIAIDVSTQLALKKHWQTLNTKQKLIFQQYITQSLVQDYASVLSSYDKLDSIDIEVDSMVKRKGNKAIVKLFVSLDNDSKPFIISLKMIRSGHWRTYDVVFSGVSLIKNYQAEFDSHIKRKGIESLIAKMTKKLDNV